MGRLAPLALALLLALGACAPRNAAPPFDLPGLDGQRFSLAQFKGSVVLVNFWATWCAPCREETPDLVRLQQRYLTRGLVVIGLSMDGDPEPVRKFRDDFKVKYPLAMADLKVAKDYGKVLGLPVTFLVGRDGGIVSKHVGAVDVKKLEAEIEKLL
jgi:peroxiredoxin